MRLLVISHTFPPSRHSNAKRPYYLVKGFLDAGWQVDVFTSANQMDVAAAETVVHPELRIFRRLSVQDRLLRRFGPNAFLCRALTLTAAGLLWPDVFVGWSLRALSSSGRAAKYDRALIFIVPSSLLLSGLGAHRVGPGWTFDYQESITPQQRRVRRRSPLQRWLLPFLTRLERHTLHKAGRAVFTAETNRRAYIDQGLVAERATVHIPYFFDAAAFRAPAEPLLPGFQIGYFGTFDWRGARSPEIFLRALARFLDQRPAARPQTRFLFHGSWLAEHNRFIQELDLQDLVSIGPALGYEQYLEKLKICPVLLLVVSAEHNLFMPSKIVDYFGARRPILAFVPPASEMRTVLERAGMAEFAADEFDVAAGALALEHLWQRYQAGTLQCDAEATRFWSSDVQVPRYLDLVSRDVGRNQE